VKQTSPADVSLIKV